MGESVPDGAGIGDVSETRRRKHSGGYAEEVQRSSRRRDQAKWYRFTHYRPLGVCAAEDMPKIPEADYGSELGTHGCSEFRRRSSAMVGGLKSERFSGTNRRLSAPQAAAASVPLPMRRRFMAKQTRCHSALFFLRPRKLNWRNPKTLLIQPKTGSTMTFLRR